MDGVLVVNKKKGFTSFDVAHKVGKILGTKKIGHTGTLDPLAEGVLVLCLGEATKIAELITAYDKEYIAGVKLGIETDTYDSEGKVLKEVEVPDNLDIDGVLSTYKKTYLQEVPIYSSVKVNGKKLYEYARSGEEVELPKKEVTIYSIECLDKSKSTFTFKAHVSKGCYIRSIIHEIGLDLGVGASMTSLIRIKQGNISIEDAYTLEDIESGNYKLYSIDEMLDIPQVVVDKDLEFKIRNGVFLDNMWNILDKVLFINNNHELLGIYYRDNDLLKTWKNFHFGD